MRMDHAASVFTSCPEMLGEATILFSSPYGFSWSSIGVLWFPPLPGVQHPEVTARVITPPSCPDLSFFRL